MSTTSFPPEFLLRVEQQIEIDAPATIVFESILEQCGPGFATLDGTSLNTKLEPWPGGRWYRDLGNNTGHLWGHVQVIKPPTLLEIMGPMMMSYAVAGHLQYRVTEKSGRCALSVKHHAIGEIQSDHREGVQKGWKRILEAIKKKAER
jgi:hypothetical protein